MNLQNFKTLKEIFKKRNLESHKEEIMETKNLLEKIIEDFALAHKKVENANKKAENYIKNEENCEKNKETQDLTLGKLEIEKQIAIKNLDIKKMIEINEKIKNLN